MKTLKEKIVEILEPTTLNDWENMASNEELERIADQILSLISQEREEMAGKIKGLSCCYTTPQKLEKRILQLLKNQVNN